MNEYDDVAAQVFGTASAKPPSNPYDVVLKQQAQGTRDEAAASLVGAVQVDPDKYARAVRLARSTGVPADVAERNPDAVAQQQRLNEYDNLLATSPVLAQKMADPEFAKLSHDEGGALSGMERAIRGFLSGGTTKVKRPDNAVVTSAEFADNVRRLQEENPALDVATARTLALVGKSVENVAPLIGNVRGTKPGIGSVVSGLFDAAKRAPAAFDAGLSYIAADLLGVDQTQNRARMENLKTQEISQTPEFETSTGAGLYAGGVSTIQNAPGMALSILTGNPAPGLALAGVQTSVPAYSKYKERGATAPMAALGALGEGAVEVATEYLPMKSLLSVFGKSGTGAGVQFLKSQMQEQWTEQVATIAQDAIDTAIANPNKTWGQYLAERPDAAYKTFLATLVQTGAITIAHTAAQKMVDSTYSVQGQAAEADAKAQQMQQLFDMAAGTKLRERNTDSLASFIQSVADDNDATPSALYVDANTLNETLQQAGVTLEQFAQMVPTVSPQIEAALASGDSVELPIGELTANLAGTGLEKVLLQHLRTTPDGLSQAEGKLATEQAQKELATNAAQAIAESAADETFAAGAEAVRANIGGQLATANRFTKDVNDAYTTLVTDFYTVMAKRLGITPEDLYARYPLKVVASSTAKRTATLDQNQPAAQSPKAPPATETIAGFATIVKAEPPERSVAGQQLLDMVHPPGKNDTTIRAEVDGKEIGYLDLAVREDGKTADVRDVMVQPGYQRQGVATALYEAAKAQGFDIQRSPYQTDEGAALTDSFEQGVTASIEAAPPVNKYAAKFLAGRQLSALSSEERAQYDSLVAEQAAPVADRAALIETLRKDPDVFWHGSPSGDLRGGGNGLHLGTYQAAKEALEARIGTPLEGEWDGTREYGKTLLGSSNTGFERGGTEPRLPSGKALYSDGTAVAMDSKPNIVPFRVKGKMTNGRRNPHEDFKANGYMRAAITKGNAKSGYFYTNEGEDSGSVSIVVPGAGHLQRVDDWDSYYQSSSVKQPARGTFSPSQLQITLLQNADLSTFLHELGHFGLEMMADLAAQPGAPVQVQDDMGKVLEWFGVADLATWRAMPLDQQRQYHEKFARGFEAYLFEGKAPNVALQGTFQRFRDWMVSVYRSLIALNVTLTDEVRGVFDRLVASDQDIADARDSRAYAPLFADAEAAGMTPDAWQAYQNLGAQQTADATDELQTRSLRDMRWLTGARNRALKALQAEAKERRASVEAEVTAEVRQLPVYAAQRWIRGKGLPDGSPAEGAKFSLPALKETYGEGPAAIWRYLPASLVSNNDAIVMPADDIGAVFGYTSGDALVRDIVDSDTEAVRIEGMTDQRMLERYGDVATPEAMARAADVAVHNEARAKFVATELLALQKATNVREKTAAGGTVNVLLRAAKEYAAAVVSRRVIKDLRPDLHAASEARAARQAEQALRKGDLVAAATAKRNQVLSGATARETYAAMAELEKAKAFFRKVMSGKDDVVGKTRDMDVVNAARAIVAQYGIGQARGKTAVEYLALVKQNDPLLFDALDAGVGAAILNAKPFEKLTVEEARGLRDEIEAMWHLAKRTREMVVGGELVDRKVAEDALLERMQEIGIPDSMPGDTSAVTAQEKRMALLRTVKAAAVRVESWAGAKDGAAPIGPFRKYIWQVVKEPADAYRADKAAYLKKYRALLEGIAPAMQRGLIEAPELGYTFGKGKDGMGMSELLHALIHTGNVSNKRKLLLGRKWASENADGTMDTSKWDAFVTRMISEGKITKASYDFAQGVWDLLEETKPLAQRAHRDVFGKYFAEVSADAFATPFGTYRGGYAPAIADPEIVQDAAIRGLVEAENENMAFAFPTTNKGFTKGRVEYNRPLKLDLRSIGQHIDKVLLFSHMEQPVRDVRKLVGAKGVAYALGRIDPPAIGSIITPWLNRSARQQVETPIVGDGGATRWFGTMRNNAGMAAMFANVANAAQQITGFSMAALKVRPKYLLGGMAEWANAPRQTADTVAEASAYMANRMQNEVGAMNSAIHDILLDPNLYEKTKAWTQRHAYFVQSAVDNVMGPIIWIGARNQALENGATEADAIRLADSAVRETQGSTLPEDVSRIETGNAFVRVFTQFMSYFNMQANLLGGEFAKIQHAGGLRQGAGRALFVTTFGFLVPAIVGEAIMQLFKSGPGDEDKDGEWLDDWLWQCFGLAPLRTATAMVPVAGPLVMAAINASNSKPYDDRLATSPAISMIEATIRAPSTVYKAIADEGNRQKAVRDVATALSMVTGIPVSGIARPLGYMAGVSGGDIAPTSPADAVRGLVTGTPSPDSKR